MNKDPKNKNRKQGIMYAGPLTVWMTAFFAAPIIIILIYSFLKRDIFGGVKAEFSLEAYKEIANPSLLLITLRTLWVSVVASFLILLIALPCGYRIALSKNQALRLFLIIVPFWTNFIVRIFAWIAILGSEGFLNDILISLGLISTPIQFLYNQASVILVLVYMYLPYAILPIFSTMDKFDFTLLEAARDLGATRFQALRKILLPNIRSGIVTALLFTFIPIFGSYAVPLLIGGMDSYMLGNVIADQITKSRNWPLAASISMVVTLITGLAAFAYSTKTKENPVVKEA